MQRARPAYFPLGQRLLLACALAFVPHAPAQSAADAPKVVASSGADSSPIYVPNLTNLLPAARDKQSLSATLQIVVLLTLLTVAPSILLMMTCFTRIVVVLVLLRQALGTQTVPPSQVLIGLSLFLTMLVMGPTWDRIHGDAIQPYFDGQVEQLTAIERAGGHLREFMFDQIEAAGNQEDVYMLYEYAKRTKVPDDVSLQRAEVPLTALVPAYLLSELKVAFVIGFRIYLPFLVIDMVIATILVSMGMMMLPPVLISFPFKLLLFVLADGWHLITGALMASVQ